MCDEQGCSNAPCTNGVVVADFEVLAEGPQEDSRVGDGAGQVERPVPRRAVQRNRHVGQIARGLPASTSNRVNTRSLKGNTSECYQLMVSCSPSGTPWE